MCAAAWLTSLPTRGGGGGCHINRCCAAAKARPKCATDANDIDVVCAAAAAAAAELFFAAFAYRTFAYRIAFFWFRQRVRV